MFILNEIDAANPAVLILLNTLFDKQPLLIPETNELITPADTFRFVATANTAGSGDDSGRFTGTNQLNQAFMDRFTILKAEYPAPADEKALLAAKFPSLPELIRDGMVDIANKVRGVFSGGRQIGFGSAGVDVVISTRSSFAGRNFPSASRGWPCPASRPYFTLSTEPWDSVLVAKAMPCSSSCASGCSGLPPTTLNLTRNKHDQRYQSVERPCGYQPRHYHLIGQAQDAGRGFRYQQERASAR